MGGPVLSRAVERALSVVERRVPGPGAPGASPREPAVPRRLSGDHAPVRRGGRGRRDPAYDPARKRTGSAAMIRAAAVLLAASLAVANALSGCGYSAGSLMPEGVTSIAVPMAE